MASLTSARLLVLVAAGTLAMSAATANASVYLQHKRVTVTLVGAISAQPCHRTHGCTQGIVDLRWGGDLVATHHVRCGRPRSLHVVKAWTGPTDWALVYACGRTYKWSLS